MRGSDLASLVMMCLSNDGKVSINRRKQYKYAVPDHVFDYIEEVAKEVLEQQQGVGPQASVSSGQAGE